MKELTIYEATRMAGCDMPEGNETDGAKWIRGVIREAEELRGAFPTKGSKEEFDKQDRVSEIADGLIPIYTNHLWNVWVDLGGYHFQGEYRDFNSMHESHGYDDSDRMNRIAQADCYEWAHNILYQAQVFWRND